MKTKLFDDQYIIITGAAGFIGSGVVEHLNAKGFTNLLLVDDFHSTDKWKNLRGKCFYDIISRYQLLDWLKGKEDQIEAIIHLGACSSTTECNWDYLMRVNYRYSIDLVTYAIENNIRFIYASSAATYGMGEKGYNDDHQLIDDLMPMNPYGYSKQLFDQWLYRHSLLDKVVGLKYFNVFGPNEYHKGRMASMVLHMKRSIEKEGVVRLFKSSEADKYKDGDQCRDFIYVKDAVAMTCFFLENDLGGIYNIGMGVTHTWNELAKEVFASLGKKENIEYIPMPQDLIGRYQNYTCANMDKFRHDYQEEMEKHFSYTPFADAIKDYVQNYLVEETYW